MAVLFDPVDLDDARAHLNQSDSTVNDVEVAGMLAAAVERVERHLGLTELPAQITGTQRLAVLEVLGELWGRSQRSGYYGGGRATNTYGGGRSEDEGGWLRLPLERRLTDLLGDTAGARGGAPQGSFPAPSGWPAG